MFWIHVYSLCPKLIHKICSCHNIHVAEIMLKLVNHICIQHFSIAYPPIFHSFLNWNINHTINFSVSSFWAVAWYDKTSKATLCLAISLQAFSYIWQLCIPSPVNIENAWNISITGRSNLYTYYQLIGEDFINLFNLCLIHFVYLIGK